MGELEKRASTHDSSKLEEPEKGFFDRLTPLLAGSTFGSLNMNNFLLNCSQHSSIIMLTTLITQNITKWHGWYELIRCLRNVFRLESSK